MAVNHIFAGIAVADLDAALAWYERLFGRGPDMVPNEREAVWWLAQAGSIYVVADGTRAGRALLTLIVDDLDAEVGELAGRGLPTGAIETIAEQHRKLVITDPEGNRITLAQVGDPAP